MRSFIYPLFLQPAELVKFLISLYLIHSTREERPPKRLLLHPLPSLSLYAAADEVLAKDLYSSDPFDAPTNNDSLAGKARLPVLKEEDDAGDVDWNNPFYSTPLAKLSQAQQSPSPSQMLHESSLPRPFSYSSPSSPRTPPLLALPYPDSPSLSPSPNSLRKRTGQSSFISPELCIPWETKSRPAPGKGSAPPASPCRGNGTHNFESSLLASYCWPLSPRPNSTTSTAPSLFSDFSPSSPFSFSQENKSTEVVGEEKEKENDSEGVALGGLMEVSTKPEMEASMLEIMSDDWIEMVGVAVLFTAWEYFA